MSAHMNRLESLVCVVSLPKSLYDYGYANNLITMNREETTVAGQDKQHRMSFASVSGKRVEATFDGGILTSDTGAMLLREVESKIGILCRIVAAITDRRHPSYSASPDDGPAPSACLSDGVWV